MSQGNMTRFGFALLSAALAVSGCDCNPKPSDCERLANADVTFEEPTTDTVESPVTVVVNARDTNGAVNFTGAKLEIGAISFDGTVSGNKASFPNLGLDPGQADLKVTLTCASGSSPVTKREATKTVTVSAPCAAPKVNALTFPQDANGDGTLNSAELPSGTNLSVRVSAQCTAGVQVQIKRGGTVVAGPADFTNGLANITIPTLPDSDNATYDLFAELVRAGTPVNSPAGNPEANGSIRVNRAAPSCMNTTKLRQGPNDDASTTTANHQLRATGDVGAGVVSATFRLGTGNPVTVTPSMGSVSNDFTVPASGTTTYALELSCTDSAGNTGRSTMMVVVDYDAPSVIITSPALQSDGGAPLVTQSPLSVTASTNAEDGAQACAYRVQGMTRTQVVCEPVSGGGVTLVVPFSNDGDFVIEVEVTDLAGNSATTSRGVTVQLTGCGAGFTRPPACPALITAAQTVNGVYSFQTSSKATCVGQPARLLRSDLLADGGMTMAAQVGATTLAAGGTATFPVTVTSGDYAFDVEVTDVGDAGLSRAHCDVTVDLDGPVITNPVVPTGQTEAIINAAQDGQPTVPGAQRVLQFSARVPNGGRVDVCTDQAVDPVTSMTRMTTPECGSGWYQLQRGVTSPANGFTFPEGQYSIKIVVVSGSTVLESAAVRLLVDVQRPCVRAASRRLPQDTAPMGGDARLNIAELGTNAPQLEFELDPSCGTTVAATNPIVVREIVSGMPTGAFTLAADVTFAAPRYTARLTQGVAPEKDYVFFVEVTDNAGNKNAYSGTMDPAAFAVRIDRSAPICDIETPSATQTVFGVAQVPGGMFGVTVGTSADVGTNGVSLTFGLSPVRQLTPMPPMNHATTSYAVSGTDTYAIAATCTDTSGNQTPATGRNITIDLDPPTCTIASPAAGMTYGTNQIQTTVNVVGAEGRLVTCSANGVALTPSVPVSSGVATHVHTYANGAVSLVCRVSDAAGNECVAPPTGSVNFTVNSTACTLNITSTQKTMSGDWHNRSNTTNIVGTSGTATVTANTPDCGAGRTVTLERTSPSSTTPVSATTNASGNVSFPNVAIAEGEIWRVRIDNGASVTTDALFRVALVPATVTGVQVDTTTVTNGANLYFVASAGNRNVETAVAGYFPDAVAGGDAQLALAIAGITGSRKAGFDGTLEVLYNGAPVAGGTAAITTEPTTISFPTLALAHNTSAPFAIRISDTAGNQTTVFSSPTAVDVIAPAAPSIGTPTLTSARAATVSLQWGPTYDDGSTASSGAHAGYDVRWTTSSVPNNNSMAASSDFFGSSSYRESDSAWSATTITRSLTLPPLNTYYLAVRARDEVGNYSPHGAPSFASLANPWTEATLSAPVASSTYGQTVAVSSSLNNDSIDDLLVSAPGEAGGGAVYLYYGSASFASQTTCGAGCQRLAPSDSTSGSFGGDIGVGGNLGDVAAEGMPDLVIAQTQSTAPNNGGRVVIFFGNASSPTVSTSTSIELRGDSTTRIGFSARIIKDIDGDGLDELAISAPLVNLTSTAQGRLFIYKGRTQAQWAAARTATDMATMVPYIPVGTATANYVVDGPATLLAPTGNAFGLNRHGLVSLGDINGDMRNDFAIPTSRPNINKYRVFSGSAVAMSTGAMPLGGENFILEFAETPTTETTVSNGLGAAAVGNLDVVASSAADLVTSFPSAGRVYVFSSPVPMMGSPSPVATIQGAGSFGYMVSVGRVNSSDTAADILAGLGLVTNNEAWLVYQNGGTFETNLGTAAAFWVTRFQGAVISGNSNTSLGRSNTIGNLDGQNGPDVVLGDDRAGLVKVYR